MTTFVKAFSVLKGRSLDLQLFLLEKGMDWTPCISCHRSDVFLCPLQCLNAVRTVQSLACLEEADHTVGFILQLSNFTKEWHFHLPQLMRDMQVGVRVLL